MKLRSFVTYLLNLPPRCSVRRTWASRNVSNCFTWKLPFHISARMPAVAIEVCRGILVCQSLQEDADRIRILSISPSTRWLTIDTVWSEVLADFLNKSQNTSSSVWFQAPAAMQGFYAAYSFNSVPTFWDNLKILSSSFPKRRKAFPILSCVRFQKNSDITNISVEFSRRVQ